jgi:hypothetical protein
LAAFLDRRRVQPAARRSRRRKEVSSEVPEYV